MIIFKIWIFKLPDIDQSIQKRAIEKKRSLEHFWKMLSREKEKKSNIGISRTTLYAQKIKFCMQNYFFQKTFVWVRKPFCGWKKNTKKFYFWGQFQKKFCCRHQKNASHTISIYGNCMTSIFLTKSFSFSFSTIHQNLCQNKRKVLRKFDGTILAKCMKFVLAEFFHRLSLWNCVISIFGLWRSTRDNQL